MREEGFAELYRGLVTWLLAQGVPSRWMVFIILTLELVTLLVLLVLAYWGTRFLLFRVFKRLFTDSESRFIQILLKDRVLQALAQLAPAILFIVTIPYVFREFEEATPVLATITYLYLVLVILRSTLTFFDAARAYFQHRPAFQNRPLNIWIQVAKIAAYAIAILVALAIIVDQPPAIVLGGLGATSAVLMLVFRDTLLGFVAGIQLYAMDMVRVGDWIEMPRYGANGDVVEINLTTVKVRNWDRTMTTVPTYALISDSVKNWRFMSAGGARRIKRSLLVDVNSVRTCDAEMLKRLRTYEQAVLPEVDEGDAGVSSADDRAPGPPVDEEGKTMTNLGMFRRYIERYLRRSPRISQTHTQMVRHLEPTRDGIPLEIYAFTNDARWTVYEQIQSDLFEHFMAMAPKYELMLFQGPAGRDLRTWGMGEGGAAGRAGPGDGREATP